jgi:aspartyl-tRNA(Asn)/glutamyl-tRNA(Gln) amidotransferase subunit C
MAAPLTRADVLRVAELARLELSEDEVDLFTRQIAEVLEYARQVQDLDTTGVSPTSHALSIEGAWRPDVVGPCLARADAFAGAPDADASAGLFKVPKVL